MEVTGVDPADDDTAPRVRPRRPTASDAFRLARATFNAGGRVEINDLADALAVNRVTVYRWLGTRPNLLADIVWSLAEPTLQQCYAVAAGRGGSRIADTLSAFTRLTLEHPGMRAFLDRENETALRVLTRSDYPLQPRLRTAIHDLLAIEHEAGDFNPAIGLDDLAYICLRVAESFVYTDTITGEAPDPDRAARALHYLLR